ncbi:MAG: type 1 periplasmic binding fold superfamily protein [Roseivirga sp.]|nr:type 1 periplasmic binding fold superfamily protein [Roseivirga sp.]
MKKLLEIRFKWLLSLTLAVLVITGCDSDDPDPVDEPELITTMNVTFTNTADATDVVTATFRDLDGEGGNDGVTTNPTLSANASYTVTVEFLNESDTPAEDITAEVREEDEEHQVFFISGANLNLTYAYGDQDADNNPIGLTGTATIGAAGSGTLDVVLVHEPMKSATGVSSGDITNAGGEEDIRVQFTVTIQ